MKFFILFLMALYLIGCGSTHVTVIPEPEADVLFVPAGVDSVVAAEAQDLADKSFVSIDAESQSNVLKHEAQQIIDETDSLWQYLTMSRDTSFEVQEEDAIEAIDAFNLGAEAILELQDLGQIADLDEEYILARQKELLDRAQAAFEEAIKLNPFDPETKYWLAVVYQRKAVRLSQERQYEKAIDILERLVRVEQGDHPIFARLAESYYAIGEWTHAVNNFHAAEKLLKETSYTNPDISEPGTLTAADSSTLFLYTYYRADALTNSYRSEEALITFNEAYQLARAPNERQAVRSMIDFINWDDGNIRASMARDSLIALRRDGQIADAERGFVSLYNQLNTQRARDEIDWRIAIIHFEMEKEDDAAERLKGLVQRTETKNEDGMPVDSLYHRYFEDYGIICFNLGTKHLQRERDRHTALKYYKQAAAIPWTNRALANFEVAKLVINNIPEAIRHAEAAIDEIETLDPDRQRELYQVLSQLYRRSGNTELARHYFELWRNT